MKKNKILNFTLEDAEISLRDKFGQILVDLGESNKDIIVLDADLSSSTKTKFFANKYPNRFFEIGIAEQNMVGIANGLAVSGKIPIVSGFTCFTIPRAWEFIRNASYDNLPLKICTTHSGLSNGRDGASHQSLEDISLIASIPKTTIYCPADPKELRFMLSEMIKNPGVCYLRLMRNKLPWVWSNEIQFDQNNFIENLFESNEGKVQITIFSTGSLTCFCPKIIENLKKNHFSIRVIHFGKIKPLNKKRIKKYCENTEIIVTLEEHNIIAGFGAQIARIINISSPKPQLCIGIKDEFGQSGSTLELYKNYKLDPESIFKTIYEYFQNITM